MKTIYLKRTIANQCPRCGEGKVLNHPFDRLDDCGVCSLKYEREQGFFLGGVPVSYFLICSLWVLPIITFWFFDWLPLNWMLGLCLGGGVVLPIVGYRYCQALWLGLYFCFAWHEMPPHEK
jgi:uncharacterized protein (DUF983 family)